MNIFKSKSKGWGSRLVGAGFTLIELLVVVAIIAVLISILLPALGNARSTAQSVSCASNQKQIWIAAQFYSQDNKEYLPYNVYGTGWSNLMSKNLLKVDNINKYNIFCCPTDNIVRVGPPVLGYQSHTRSYTLNAGIADPTKTAFFWGYTIKARPEYRGATSFDGSCTLSMISDPTYTNFLMEYHDYGNYFEGSSAGCGNGRPDTTTLMVYHSGAANYLFCDGHVQRLKPFPFGDYWKGMATISPDDRDE